MLSAASQLANCLRRRRLALHAVAFLLVAASSGSLSAQQSAPAQPVTYPATVLIIRHAEKPPEKLKSDDLNATGRARASALVRLFRKSPARPEPLPVPDFIFATRPTKRSERPSETVEPLSRALGLHVDAKYEDAETAKLARHLFHDAKYAGKTILISWHQGMIPTLARDLHAAGTPANWKETVFDSVWVITYGADGKASFRDLPQHLLPSDSER